MNETSVAEDVKVVTDCDNLNLTEKRYKNAGYFIMVCSVDLGT